MTRDQWSRVRCSLEAVLDVPANEREQVIHRICGEDTELAFEVRRLANASEGDGILDRDITVPGSELVTLLSKYETLWQEGEVLAERFRILRVLGKGGMGQVFEALDQETNRTVAIKTIRSEWLKIPGAVDRLKQELVRAREVTHPNVCRVNEFFVHSTGQGGIPFLTMEMLHGETLAKHLANKQPLPADFANSILDQCAAGLEAAHRAGLVHRDFKPANIMLVPRGGDTAAVITDFGIACPIIESGEGELPATTGAGTPAYMAPEQAEGKGVTTAADVYSFAVVACEVLTGSRPQEGGLSLLPGPWREVIRRGLDPDPKRRPERASDILRTARSMRRRRLLAAVLVPLGLGLAVAGSLRVASHPEIPSIAVLPLSAAGGEGSTEEVFGESFAEDLIRSLSRNENLRVVPRSSSFLFDSANPNHAEIARKLAVRYLVAGHARMRGGRVHVNMSLIDAPAERVVWSESYDRAESEYFALQEQVAGMIPLHLGISRTLAPQTRVATRNFEAYNAYMHARYHLNRRRSESLPLARKYFEQAIRLESSLAEASAGLSETLVVMAERGLVPASDGLEQASQAAARALELDARLGEAYAVQGFVQSLREHNYRSAEQNFRLALDLDPDLVIAHQWYSYMLLKLRRYGESETYARRALDLEPLSVPALQNLAAVYFNSGQLQSVKVVAAKLLELDPNHYFAHLLLAHAYAREGRREESLREVEAGMRSGGDSAAATRLAGEVYVLLNLRPEAQARLDELIRAHNEGKPVPDCYIGILHAALGNRDAAFAWFDSSWQKQEPFLSMINTYPLLAPLRSDPRFESLAHRMGFTENKSPD